MENITFVRFSWTIILAALLNATGVDLSQAQVIEDGGSANSPRSEAAKITLGVVEDILLSPWGISFAARIDTGADLSSLDARDITVRNNVADFTLGKRWGSRRIQLPVVEWTQVQTAMGIEKRPVVEISICLGPKHFTTLATLKNRSEMIYPFLVGRSALSGNFLVDSSRSRAVPPSCSKDSATAN